MLQRENSSDVMEKACFISVHRLIIREEDALDPYVFRQWKWEAHVVGSNRMSLCTECGRPYKHGFVWYSRQAAEGYT